MSPNTKAIQLPKRASDSKTCIPLLKAAILMKTCIGPILNLKFNVL